jgi:uncharacterized protein (DUF1330 family)
VPAIDPTPEQFRDFVSAPSEGPILMINMLRFRETAAYPDGFDAAPCSGREAYERYSEGATKKLALAGGEIVWSAEPRNVVIGEPGERWDEVFAVSYPSRDAFVTMITDPEYQAFVLHRTASLEDSRLIQCVPGGPAGTAPSSGD